MPQRKTNKYTHARVRHAAGYTPFTFASHSIACERHPDRNEDAFLVEEQSGLVAVFDGVGGSAAGEIASRTAVRATRQGWHHILEQLQIRRKVHTILEYNEKLSLCTILEHLIQQADELVRTEGAHLAGTDDLATTVAMAAVYSQPHTSDYQLVYAHVGDSRIYLLREHEPIQRLTNDDGLLAKLVESNIVAASNAQHIDQAMRAEDLTDTEYSYFRLRGGITQALGSPVAPTIHTDQITIAPGDRVLLCTDGIHDNLIDEEIETILRDSPRQTSARRLVEASLKRSREERGTTVRAKPDDMTAVVMTCRHAL